MPIWVSALVTWLINVLALIVVDWLFDGVAVERWGPILLAAAVLALANAFLKPVLALLTLPLIIVTLGISYFLINILTLLIAEWVTPDFSIDGFWTYVGAVIVIWFVNLVVGSVLGVRKKGPISNVQRHLPRS
jgi:putative membrane protein